MANPRTLSLRPGLTSERTWTLDIAQTTEHRNKSMYQAEISKDKDKHNEFLAARMKLIARHKGKHLKPKRSGGHLLGTIGISQSY